MNTRVHLASFAALMALTIPLAAQQDGQRQMDAQSITDAIENEFAFHPAVPLNEIDVRTADGVVTLTGTVDNLLAKDYATRLAETVKGVRLVVNDIAVEPHWHLMDWEIENDVEKALLRNRTTESYEVDVDVDAGIARLTGLVDSWTEKRTAERVAKGVRGVAAVTNDITVDYETERPDREIQKDVEARLKWDALVDDGLIQVAVVDGRVTLTGTVGSAAEKSRAKSDAWVMGTDEVDVSGLEVARWARDDDLAKDYSVLSDGAIEDAVETNLAYDARVISFDIAVDVDDRVATLRGTVDNLMAKRAAENTARETFGVVAVENRIRVRPSTPDDEEVEERIEDAIERDPYVERYEIDAQVIDGTAYLYGTVDTYFEKSRADTVAATVYGVTEVKNNLVVDDPSLLVHDPYLYDPYPYTWTWYDYEPGVSYLADWEIRDDIRDELWWSPFVDADQVNVRVEDGVATLTGTVDSWSERGAATENAFEGGAVWVRNLLEVKSVGSNGSQQ